MCAEQLPLDFNFRPSLQEGDFMLSACNDQAVRWLDRWPDWPAPFLLIYGPEACGKSHLAEVFKSATNAKMINLASNPYEIMGDEKIAIIDDLDGLGKDEQNQLFHLYNYARENDCFVLITSRRSFDEWDVTLADLKSRFGTVPQIEITQPDDSLLEALLLKQFSDRQLLIDSDVVTYLLSRMERSFKAAKEAVDKIDQFALKNQRKITIPLVRQALQL